MKAGAYFIVAACIVLTTVPALAVTPSWTAALAAPSPGCKSKIEEQTDTHIAVWSWKAQNEDDYYITEINVGGSVVAGFRNTFSAMAYAMDTVEAGGQTFTFDGDMYATFINNAVLVRVYGTAPQSVKLAAIDGLDFEALRKLADEN